jgi:hypothetical protein
MFKQIGMMAALAACVGACAKSADQISAAYVSPLQYERYDCRQLGEEIQRVSARAAELTGAQNQKASNDAVAMTVGMVIFWPALFLIKGNDQQAGELARIRGEMEAIEKESIRKKCGFQFQHAPTPTPESQADMSHS